MDSLKEKAAATSIPNLMRLAATVYGDPLIEMKHRALLKVGEPVHDWHKDQNAFCRDVESNLRWTQEQAAGACIQHLNAVGKVLRSGGSLSWVGLALPGRRGGSSPTNGGGDMDMDVDELLQNSVVGGMAVQALCLVGYRTHRTMHLTCGWGCRSSLLLAQEPEIVKATLDSFRAEAGIYDAMCMHKDDAELIPDMVRRCQFALTSVEQLRRGLQTCDGAVVSEAFLRFLQKRHRRVVSSQLPEDCFNRQKGQKSTHLTRRLKISKAWSDVLDTEVVNKVHRYEFFTSTGHAPQPGKYLAKHTFQPRLCTSTAKSLKPIMSYTQHTDWFSCKAERHSIRYADLLTANAASARDAWGLVDSSWLSCLLRATHRLVIRVKTPNAGSSTNTYFPCVPVPGSVAIVMPAVEERVPGTEEGVIAWHVSDASSFADLWCATLDLGDIEAQPVEWRCPLWQENRFGEHAPKDWSSTIRAFPANTRSWEPLLVVAAMEGFWDLNGTTLKDLGEYLGIAMPEGEADGWYDAVEALITKIVPGASDEQKTDFAKRRVLRTDPHAVDCLDALLELDEAEGQLGRDDAKELKKMKQAAEAKDTHHQKFYKRWVARRKEVMKDYKERLLETSVAKYPPLPLEGITQEAAKQRLPPGAYVWRNLAAGGWCVHLKPWPRKSFAWQTYGFHESCRRAVAHVVLLWLFDNGLEQGDWHDALVFQPGSFDPQARAPKGGLAKGKARAPAAAKRVALAKALAEHATTPEPAPKRQRKK